MTCVVHIDVIESLERTFWKHLTSRPMESLAGSSCSAKTAPSREDPVQWVVWDVMSAISARRSSMVTIFCTNGLKTRSLAVRRFKIEEHQGSDIIAQLLMFSVIRCPDSALARAAAGFRRGHWGTLVMRAPFMKERGVFLHEPVVGKTLCIIHKKLGPLATAALARD